MPDLKFRFFGLVYRLSKVLKLKYVRQYAVFKRTKYYQESQDVAIRGLVDGLEQCVKEFNGEYKPSRRPWRTLIRVVDTDESRSLVSVVIPSWDPNKVINLDWGSIPEEVKRLLGKQSRFHAKVNTGAEDEGDLFFEEWEIA